MTVLPPYAHVPGLNARHPEGAFDGVRASVAEGMDPDALALTEAWRTGRAWLDAGYYWEAHEVLEPVWMACPPNSAERRLVRALIQLANAKLKQRMGRPRARDRLLAEAAGLLAECRMGGTRTLLAVSLEDSARALEAFREACARGAPEREIPEVAL